MASKNRRLLALLLVYGLVMALLGFSFGVSLDFDGAREEDHVADTLITDVQATNTPPEAATDDDAEKKSPIPRAQLMLDTDLTELPLTLLAGLYTNSAEAAARLQQLQGEYFNASIVEAIDDNQQTWYLVVHDDSFKKLSFMRQELRPAIPPPASFLWSETRLREALSYFREYETYNTQHIQTQSAASDARGDTGDADQFLHAIVRAQLQKVIERSLRSAQRAMDTEEAPLHVIAEETSLAQASDNFSEVMPSFIEILDRLGQLNFTATENWFRTATQDYAVELVNRVDRLSKDPRPLYAPTLFPDWSKLTFLAALFDLPSEEMLHDYLVGQRQRVSYLAFNYAQSPITYLSNTNYTPLLAVRPDNLVKWRETLEQLDKYRQKNPSSHLQILEKFFQDALQEHIEDCKYGPNPSLAGHSDIFARSRQKLIAEIEGNCRMKKSD